MTRMLLVIACGAAATAVAAQAATGERPHGAVASCSTRSGARFPAAFSDRRNVVVGPLVLVGAASTAASTVRRFGGEKFPALVRAGHRVTVALSPGTRRVASLGYGPIHATGDRSCGRRARISAGRGCRTPTAKGSRVAGAGGMASGVAIRRPGNA